VQNSLRTDIGILDGLIKNAAAYSDKTAIMCEKKHLSYKSLLNNSLSLAKQLNFLRSEKEEYWGIGLFLENDIQLIVNFISIVGSKAVPLLFDPSWSQEQLENIVEIYSPKLLLTSEKVLAQFKGILAHYCIINHIGNRLILQCKKTNETFKFKENMLFVGFTSGTTTLPKAYLQTHHAWKKSMAASASFFGIDNQMTVIVPGPLVHGLSLYATFEGLTVGASVIFLKKFDPSKLINLFTELTAPLSLVVVPTMLNKLIGELECETKQFNAKSFNSVKKIITAGSKLSKITSEKIETFFPKAAIYEYYGASELGFITANITSVTHPFNHSVGQVFPGVKIKITDRADKPLPVGEIGTVWVQSPYISQGYVMEADKLGFRQKGDWATVGDQGYLDLNHYLFLIGRDGDLIITGGVKCLPRRN